MKNLRITGITQEKNLIVYVPDIRGIGIFNYDAEYYGKRAPVKVLCPSVKYKFALIRNGPNDVVCANNTLRLDEVIVSQGLAEELGLELGYGLRLKTRIWKTPRLNTLEWYEKNPKKFIKYFKQQKELEKKKLLRELLEHDTINEEVVSYLDKHESKLIKEVGLE
ncbi:hypothetical protein FJZ53_01685 [Candidatus Woesearchaeota archaeon]|nr:hypothetical protein [Candidatus Woesearchaeota archaeon]